LASSFFDLKEYDRAAYFVQDCRNKKAYFLHMYGRYLADEKRKLDNAPDSIGKNHIKWNLKIDNFIDFFFQE
jgi:anaphase-promoting complex subunit 8